MAPKSTHPRDVRFDNEALAGLRRGVEKLAKAVKVTLGPSGRVVVLEKEYGQPTVTKDGVTVAREIVLADAYENVGAQMVREVAQKTVKDAGDGTTTATIYAEAIFLEGLKNITAGASANQVRRGIDAAVRAVVQELARMARDVTTSDQIAQVGTCAANGDEAIGEIIAEAMDKVGNDGVILIEEARSAETTVDLIEGMQFDRGWVSPYFINEERRAVCGLERPLVLVCDMRIDTVQPLIKLMEKAAGAQRPLLVVAHDFSEAATATLAVNAKKGILTACAVKAPGYGDHRRGTLGDIAALTGATVISEEEGRDLAKVELRELGSAEQVQVTRDTCTIVKGGGPAEAVEARIASIRQAIDESQPGLDREKLEERLSRLAGGLARINVGGATESAVTELKFRVEDAVHACRAAVEEGILPGGGVAPLRALAVLDTLYADGDQRIGLEIVRRALAAPIKQIAANAGHAGDVVVHQVLELGDRGTSWGFNAATGVYGDMIEMGVLVPTKVERVALQNAASVAGLLLTTDAVVTRVREDDPAQQTGARRPVALT